MKKIYNSWLFVPAVIRFLRKVEECSADAVIIDLEDAIKESDKDVALKILGDFLSKYSGKKDIFVRINPDSIQKETEILNCYPIVGYMLPKTESDKDIAKLKKLAGDKKIIALIESPVGIINIEKIVLCTDVDYIAFGAEDYTSANGIKNQEEFLVYPKSKIVTYAKVYSKPVIDTISLNVTDVQQYTKSAQISKDYGFDGKLAIHPFQVDIINKVFKSEDLNYYKQVIEKYDKSEEGVLRIDGNIFEKPHIDAMRKKIREYESHE